MAKRTHHSQKTAPAQVQAPLSDLWATEVVPHLPADLEAQARLHQAFLRKRKLACAADLLRGILAYVLVTSSFCQLGIWAVVSGVGDLSAPAWHQRLHRSSAFLLWLLGELLAPPPAPSPPTVRLLAQANGKNILLVDATRLGQVGGSGDDWRLHTGFNLTIGRLVQVAVTDRKGGEHLGYYRIQPGDIIVADNGYGYRRSVATLRKQQAHGVFRIHPATFPLETAAGQAFDVLAWLRKRGSPVREWQGWCSDTFGERYQVRLVAAKLPQKEAAQARRRAREKAAKRGRAISADSLLLASWVLLITTLSMGSWPAADVLRLYRARWQVELVYKRMKQILEVKELRCVSRESCEACIRALLIAWALQEAEACLVRKLLGQIGAAANAVVSSWLLTTLSVDTLRQQVRGQWSCARVRACLPRLQRFLTSRRRNRVHQETEVRAWLERRPAFRIVAQQLAA